MALWATWKSKQVQVLCLCSVRRIWSLLSTTMRPVWWVSWSCNTCRNILNHFCSRSSKQIILSSAFILISLGTEGGLSSLLSCFALLCLCSWFCSGFFSGEDSTQLAEFLKVSSALRESYRFAHSTDVGTGLKYGVDGEYVWHRAWRKQPFEKLRDYDQDLFAVRSSANLKRT